ncbi:MAG: peptidoglycan DD-metalloendopeptidase family protein [Gammaproteobacteria bacterium]
MTRNIRRFVLFALICLSCCSPLAYAIDLPENNPIPGGIAIIELNERAQLTPDKPIVRYKGRRVMVVKNDNQWYAAVGIPLSAKTGDHKIDIQQNGIDSQRSFTVKEKTYKSQHITIKDKRKVEPNAKDLQRIKTERLKINEALRDWQDKDLTSIQFTVPIPGELSSPFGLRRFFNGQPRKPHSGIDIAAPEGTPIRAPIEGIVINTGNYFFNGNSVFIQHGQGLVTMYCHLNEITVKEGQTIYQGEQIGTVGMTGRATGPHLHWSVSMNDARINPVLLLPGNTFKNSEL